MPDQPSDAPAATTRADLRAQRSTEVDAAPAGPGDAAADSATRGTGSTDLASNGLGSNGAGPSGITADGLDFADLPDDWRLGGPSVAAWREWLLAGGLMSLGVAILLGTVIVAVWPGPWAAASATLVLWIGLLVPVAFALARSRPAGLLGFRALDLLYGVMLGGVLRLTQGWLAIAFGGSGALPSYPLVDGALPTGWWITDGLGSAVIAPVLEEFFFRGVIIVALFTVLRRPVGGFTAGLVALLVSTGLFTLVHGLTLTLPPDAVLSITLLGLVCGLLVLLTRRIWPAVLVHVVFNATYVALALIGTHWG